MTGPIGASQGLALAATAGDSGNDRAQQIRELTSYGVFDWSVSRSDQDQVLSLLRSDPNLDATLADLASDANMFGASSLTAMIKRVDIPELRREMIDTLAQRSGENGAERVRQELNDVDIASGGYGSGTSEQVWQLRFNLVRLGVPTEGAAFDRAPYADLVSGDPTQPFTGAGASGVTPTDIGVPLGDQWRMFTGDPATTTAYSNPVGGLNTYLDTLPPGDRARQAELFLSQPIASPMTEVWGDRPPSRAQVIEVAARQYNLEPELVAGFLLAEQRDQSRNEDAKDIAAALNAFHNSSIGLGQVVISTARNHELFQDVVSPEYTRVLDTSTYGMTRMLSDDAANIFASARYIRQVADSGSATPLATLEARTLAADQQWARDNGTEVPTAETYNRVVDRYPGFDPAAYSGHSSTWPDANIAALGSEYTSRAWDGRWSAWGSFVQAARSDVVSAGVFP